MARLPRIVIAGEPHIVSHRGHSGQPVFLDPHDRARYLSALNESARAARVALHGYALGHNEVRLLATPETAQGLADMMQSVGRHFVPGFNRKYGRTGSPWGGRFRSTVIEAGAYFLASLRFVERLDGLASGDTDSGIPLDSSAAHHLGSRVDPLVRDHPAFWALGNTPFEREAAYREFLATPDSHHLAGILLDALNGWALGSVAFRQAIADQTGRRSSRAGAGRPRKRRVDPSN